MSVLRLYVGLARRYPALRSLLVGEFVSGIGDWLYLIAIIILVYAATESPLILGITGAARILPYVLLSVPAGMIVDRYDRRTVLLVTDIARGLLMLVLAAMVAVGAPIGLIVGGAVLAAAFSTLFGPAIAALIPALVDEEDLGPAFSAWATLDNVAFIIGPAVAGVLIALGGLAPAFLVNAATFAVVAVVLWRLPVPPRTREPVAVDEPEDGAASAAGGRGGWLRGLVRPLAAPFVLDSATSFVGGGLSMLTVIIAIDVLGAGDAGTGYLNAATGVGGVVAGIGAGVLLARSLRLPILVGGAVSAVGLAWLALAGDLLVAMVAIGVAVAGALVLDVVVMTLVQRSVPDALRGRAVGLLQTSSALFMATGALVVPIVAVAVGVGPVLVASALLTAAGSGIVLVAGGRAAADPELDPLRARVLRLPIFRGLPAPRLEAAARAMAVEPVRAGDVVVRQGDPADRFYVIADGRFVVEQSVDGAAPERLRELTTDDVFGEIGLLRRSPRTATVTAATDGTLLAMDAATFLELVGSGPGLGSRLLDLYRGALAS